MERRNPLFRNVEGLIHKSYLFEEEEKVYAPFYVWRDNAAFGRFLVDGLFDGVANEFGRPRVRTWQVIEFGYGDRSKTPTFACCEIDQVGQDQSLSQLVAHEGRQHSENLGRPGLYAHAVALDPDRWEIRRLWIWDDKRSVYPCTADCVCDYRVLGVYDGDSATG